MNELYAISGTETIYFKTAVTDTVSVYFAAAGAPGWEYFPPSFLDIIKQSYIYMLSYE